METRRALGSPLNPTYDFVAPLVKKTLTKKTLKIRAICVIRVIRDSDRNFNNPEKIEEVSYPLIRGSEGVILIQTTSNFYASQLLITDGNRPLTATYTY